MRITKGSFGDDFLVEGLGGESWKRPVVKGGFFSKVSPFPEKGRTEITNLLDILASVGSYFRFL